MVTDLLIITAVVVFIVDLSGFSDSLLTTANRIVRPYGRKFSSLKPFTCSLCSAWWLGLLYLLVTHRFTIAGIGVVAACSLLTGVMANALMLAKDSLLALIDILQRLIDRI